MNWILRNYCRLFCDKDTLICNWSDMTVYIHNKGQNPNPNPKLNLFNEIIIWVTT